MQTTTHLGTALPATTERGSGARRSRRLSRRAVAKSFHAVVLENTRHQGRDSLSRDRSGRRTRAPLLAAAAHFLTKREAARRFGDPGRRAAAFREVH